MARAAPACRRRIDCDLPAHVRRLEPDRAPLLAVARQAALRRGRSAAFVPGQSVQAERSAGACNGASRLRAAASPQGAAAGAAAARAAGFTAEPRRAAARSDEPDAGPPLRRSGPSRGPAARRFVDFQNDVTAEDIGPRRARGLHARSSTSSATPRPAWAPTRARPRNVNALGDRRRQAAAPAIAAIGTTTFRPPYTPVTFGALAGPNRDELFDPVRAHADPRLARAHGRRVRGCRPLEAARYYPQAGEDMHAAVARECRAVRAGRRHARRHHARQDRHPGSGCGRAPGPHLHQRLEEPRGRPLPLRPDAARGRHGVRRRRHRAPRRRPLPHDHDHRRRRARAGLARGVAADRVAATSRSTAPRSPSSGRRSRVAGPQARERAAGGAAPTSTSPPRPSRTWRCARARSPACRRASSAISFSGELGYEVNVPCGLWRGLSGKR